MWRELFVSDDKLALSIKNKGILVYQNKRKTSGKLQLFQHKPASTVLTAWLLAIYDPIKYFFFFFLHSNKNLQYGFTSYTTYRILNYTTRTMPLGAKYYDYSVASQKTKTIYIWITKGKKYKTWKRSKEHYTLSQTRYQVKNVREIIADKMFAALWLIVWVILHFHRSHLIYNLRQALHMIIN